MKKSHLLLLLLSACLTAACRQELPKNRMVDLLTEMYLYEDELAKGMKGADSVSIYRSVFLRHGCTEAEYRKAIAHYAQQPKEMKEIYAEVKLRLEKYKTEFEQALQLEDSLRNLWLSPYDTLFQSTEIPPYSYAFSIPVDTLCTYTLSVLVHYFEDDSTRRPLMKGYLWGRFEAEDSVQGRKKFPERVHHAVPLEPEFKTVKKMELRSNVASKPELNMRKNLKKMQPDNREIRHQAVEADTVRHVSDTVRHVSDTVRQEKEVVFIRGETKEYTMSFTVEDTLVTHIRGFWLLTEKRDSVAPQHIYLSRFRVYKPRQAPLPLVPEHMQNVEQFKLVP